MKRRWWCDGKVRHKSEGAALAHIRALKKRDDGIGCIDPESLRPYKCRTCLMWHVGHLRERPATPAEGATNGEAQREDLGR